VSRGTVSLLLDLLQCCRARAEKVRSLRICSYSHSRLGLRLVMIFLVHSTLFFPSYTIFSDIPFLLFRDAVKKSEVEGLKKYKSAIVISAFCPKSMMRREVGRCRCETFPMRRTFVDNSVCDFFLGCGRRLFLPNTVWEQGRGEKSRRKQGVCNMQSPLLTGGTGG
jgi:hypothetical protein